MKKYILILYGFLIASCALISCDDMLDVDPEEVLLTEDYLGDDKIEARSALFGVLSQMQDAVEQYVVLGELRADLMDVATGAKDELRKINLHDISENNSYVNPTNLFSIVNNCNFALQGMDTVAYENELLPYYVSILRVRTWAQFQILTNYGKLPYMLEPVESTEDLNDEYPVLTFNQGLDSLINNLLPYSNIETVSDIGVSAEIPKNDLLLGDLYLWSGDYIMAATYYKQFLDYYVNAGGGLYNLTQTYGIEYSGKNGNYSVSTNNWINIFEEETPGSYEYISLTKYDDDYRQYNTAYETLVTEVKASIASVSNWSVQYKYYEDLAFEQGDNRVLGSYDEEGDETWIKKYQYDYFMYTRAAHVYLKYAEAINAAGYPAHALAVINNGVFDDSVTVGATRFIGNAQDFLNFDQSKYVTTSSGGLQTGGNLGIRGRVGMAPRAIEGNGSLTLADSINQVRSIILEEAALETAFEGNRYGDLVRASRNFSDASIIAKAVASKFTASGDAGTAAMLEQKLSDPENWFLPFSIPDNFVLVTPDAEE
ncbi:RagB/SusD family nutrient uptake outer membrane protein [Saccharicrinis fermentans]|nr:RagB/SusD family nutrient uptake outer membrane protein [Saccharicrinis fermentans]